MNYQRRWIQFAVLVFAGVMLGAGSFAWSASPKKHKPAAAASVKKQPKKTVQMAQSGVKKPAVKKVPAAKPAARQPVTTLAGVIYTPESITGDDDIVFTPGGTFNAAGIFTVGTRAVSAPEDYATYTVRFDKKIREDEGIAPIAQTATYPVPTPISPVKGALFQVQLFFLNGATVTPIDPAWYSITGLNGVQKLRRRATFDLAFNPTTFQLPNGLNSVDVLIVVKRINTDTAQTTRSAPFIIRVHKQGF